MFLLDTNVVSELRKAGSPKVNSGVEQWASSNPGERAFISVVTSRSSAVFCEQNERIAIKEKSCVNGLSIKLYRTIQNESFH